MDFKQLGLKIFGGLLGIGKLMLVVVAIAAALALLVALSRYKQGIYAELPRSAAVTWLVIVGLVAVLVVLFFAARGVVRVFVSPGGLWSLFGDTATSRIIGLGAVTLIFPRAIVSLVTVPISVLVQFFANIPQIIDRMIQTGPKPEHAAVSLDQVFYPLIPLLQGIAVEVSKSLLRLFQQIPVYDAVVALALWAIIGQLLSYPGGAAPAGSMDSRPVRLIAYFRNLTDPQRRYLWIGLIFFVGIYLSIAAIVAIPWLQEEKAPQGLTRDNLQKSLEMLVPKGADADKAGVAATDVSKALEPLTQVEAALTKTKQRLNRDRTSDVLAFRFESIRRDIADAKAARQSLYDRSQQLRDDIRQRQSQIISEAINAFESETLSPMSVQERAFFFRDIHRSVQYEIADMQRALRDCVRSISEADKQIDNFVSNLRVELSRFDSSAPNPDYLRGTEVNAPALFSSRTCVSMSLGPIEYESPIPGATWGPFALVAQWLLRTKSHALALITGMLGFGLLGAAIATFIKPPDSAVASSPAGDAATIIIRGLSAAIVIFLAAKGGLAIVSGNEAEPNAYVLFFACLVGAVFSEGVWQWAKSKLDGIFSQQKEAVNQKQIEQSSDNARAATGAEPGASSGPGATTPPS